MTDDEINELLAIEVMKFLTGTVKTYTVEEWSWRDSDGVYLMRKDDWSPVTDISQAIECAEKWCKDNKKWCSFQIYYDEPYITSNEKWRADVAGNTVIDKYLARAICLVLCEAVKK